MVFIASPATFLERVSVRYTFNQVQRTTLFYNRWPYCLKAYQPEFFCLRRLDHAHIDHVINLRRDWGRRMAGQPGSWFWQGIDITEQDQANLHLMCDWLLQEQRPHKLITATSWFYIYTDDRSLIDDVSKLTWLDPNKMKCTEVKLIGRPNTITRKKARHAQRTYFRNMRLDSAQKQNLANLLANNQDLGPSPALFRFLNNDPHSYIRIQDYFFVDHDHDACILLLALTVPGIVRKTLPIEQYK